MVEEEGERKKGVFQQCDHQNAAPHGGQAKAVFRLSSVSSAQSGFHAHTSSFVSVKREAPAQRGAAGLGCHSQSGLAARLLLCLHRLLSGRLERFCCHLQFQCFSESCSSLTGKLLP